MSVQEEQPVSENWPYHTPYCRRQPKPLTEVEIWQNHRAFLRFFWAMFGVVFCLGLVLFLPDEILRFTRQQGVAGFVLVPFLYKSLRRSGDYWTNTYPGMVFSGLCGLLITFAFFSAEPDALEFMKGG